jgi:PAS domain S-box-containing protein
MRALAGKTRELEEEARREQAEQSLRVTQLSILKEISRGILGQLDLDELTAAVTQQLREALGYEDVRITLGPSPPEGTPQDHIAVCPIREGQVVLGHLVAANRPGSRPIDPRERELLEMLCDYLAVAVRNSRLYGEVADTKRSLEQLIRSAGDAIVSVDREGRIAGWNPAAERIFGWTADQALGHPLVAIIPEGAYRAARLALSPEEPVHTFEVAIRRDDARSLNLAVTLSALTGPEGALDGLLAIVRDVTSQRELEAQVQQSEKLTALGQLAGGIAHDFNNLLQAILGYAQLMGRNPANADTVRRGLDVIESAATSGAETVRRIQKFARLRPDEPFVAVNLAQVVKDALAITRPRWEEHAAIAGVRLQLELGLSPVPPIMGRPSELGEVMTNLILNAIDAMPKGGTLTLRVDAEGSGWVRLVVADTGLGMIETVRKRVFDPFFTTKGDKGTGLGLSVSYSIVRRHGGDMRVDSEPGHGATFTIRLPVSTPQAPDTNTDDDPGGTRRGRILLVDNEAHVLAILGEMLKDAGHEVVPAAGGEEALQALRAVDFDLLVTNIGMPGVTGWELAERVRSTDARLPIMFVTGWGLREQDQARCRGLGIAAVLFKPVAPSDLQRAVQRGLAAGAPSDAARATDAR